MPRKTFANGFPLPASDLNTYLMDQSVQTYADATARTAALATPVEGQMSYLADTNTAYVYDGSSWNAVVDAKNYATVLPTRRNAIINGAFDFWQRGTSIAYGTVLGYGCDRFQVIRGGWSSGATLSRQSAGLTGFRYAARVQRDSGNTSTQYVGLSQTIETSNSIGFAGQTVTLSFYARAGANFSAASSLLNVAVFTGTGTDENVLAGFTGSSTINNTNPTLTTTWQKFTATMSVGSSATEIGFNLNYTPVGTAGAADYFEVTGIQLETGSVATPFARAAGTLQGELAACQRYYVRFQSGGNYAIIGNGYTTSTTNADINISLPVPMRVTPTSVDYSTLLIQDSASGGYSVSALALGANYSSPFNANVGCTIAGATAGRYARILNNNNVNGYIGFSAEL